MIRKASSSAKSVPLRSSSPASAGTRVAGTGLLHPLGDRGDEVEAEREVDEVHRLDQADDEEHDRLQATLCLGLAGHAADGGIARQTVTDGGADGAPSEGEAGADQRPGYGDCVVHLSSLWACYQVSAW